MGEAVAQDSIEVWIGTHGADGIFQFDLNKKSGKMTEPKRAAKLASAGFLVMNQDGSRLYSTGRHDGNVGYVASFEVDRGGEGPKLKPLNTQEIGDSGAAHLNVDRDFAWLMSAQYGGSSIAVFPLQTDGTIGARQQFIKHTGGSRVVGNRQDDPHPHWIGPSPNNRLICVPDLGLDAVVVYELSADGLTEKSKVPLTPGSGPRHMKFHTNGKWAYVLNEFSLTVSVFDFDEEQAKFNLVQEIASLPDDLKSEKYLDAGAEIRIHPNGKWVYTSNRGHDSITVFSINAATGKLAFLQREPIHGSWPRNFALDPSGKWLLAAGRNTN